MFIQIHTDEGVIGLGETVFGPRAVEAYLHETPADLLIGKDALQIDRHSRALTGYVGYRSSGAEMRGNSAIDIALRDIFGKATNQPLHALLGGKVRNSVHVYNTCAGYRYVRSSRGQRSDNWGLETATGPYEDLDAFLNRAGELAESLLAEGIVMVDVSWCGGVSEARKIANLAETYQRPVMFHDCAGPVVYAASTPSLAERHECAGAGVCAGVL